MYPVKDLGTGSRGNVCLSNLTIKLNWGMFLAFQEKLNSFLKIKFGQHAARAFTSTQAQVSEKIILFRCLESKR